MGRRRETGPKEGPTKGKEKGLKERGEKKKMARRGAASQVVLQRWCH
jgi:hypothetical protein